MVILQSFIFVEFQHSKIHQLTHRHTNTHTPPPPPPHIHTHTNTDKQITLKRSRKKRDPPFPKTTSQAACPFRSSFSPFPSLRRLRAPSLPSSQSQTFPIYMNKHESPAPPGKELGERRPESGPSGDLPQGRYLSPLLTAAAAPTSLGT